MPDRPGQSPFPPRAVDSIRADSQAEELAYIAAWPPAAGAWTPVESVFIPGIPSMQKRVLLQAPDGTQEVIHFLVGASRERGARSRQLPGELVEAVMRAGHALAKEEGPLHPGTMPQYPVPAPAHAHTVSLPLPILAIDAGRRWLYAPPRVAVVRWPGAEAVGVGDAPGFDPEHWPPRRLGDWPPAAVRGWEQQRLAGAVARFTSIWGRLLDVWFGGERYLQLDDERREALLLLGLLEPEGMLAFYAEISPPYWAWLRQ